MPMHATNTQLLTEYLDKRDFNYSVDNNPTPEKINRIRKALNRKENLMSLAVSTYKQVIGR